MLPEEKVETPVTEAPNKEMPEGDAPFKTTEEPAEEASEKSSEISIEAEEIADAIKPGEENAAEEKPAEEEDEVAKLLKEVEAEDTPNVQKRIDRLSAELKALKAENAKLQSKPAEKPQYTEEQLAHAMMKAVEDNNPDLMRDVIAEIKTGIKDEMIKMYTEEKQSGQKQASVMQAEWDETVQAYKKYSDPSTPAIWPTSHKDLDLNSATSMLYQVAMALYYNKDEAKAAHYRQPGGQKLAVADALTYLIRNKAGKGTETKVKKLEKQLIKERIKKSPVSGGPSGDEKSSRRPQSEADTLAEVIAERAKFQEERGI